MSAGTLRRVFLATSLVLGLALAAEAPRETDRQSVLKWQARDERGVYGYVVYRAERREGPYRRISCQIIRVAPRADGVGEYAYVDRDVRAGASYFYYLDTVGLDGRKRRFSGVISKTVDPD